MLSIENDAYKELPDLSEAWAWAHVQVISLTEDETEDENELKEILGAQREKRLSRLMCPRSLEKKKAYYACLVPTFLGGVEAGLGKKVVDGTVQHPAWTLAPDLVSIQLPVYYSWEFTTGDQGDFESLVWQLEHKKLTFKDIGIRKLNISVKRDMVCPQAMRLIWKEYWPRRPQLMTNH